MIVAGLTGGIGSGKSTVSGYFRQRGAEVLDADAIAHRVIEKGTAVYQKILSLFGEEILGRDQQIDRKRLGKIVFNDSMLREKLNQIVHPVVYQEGRQQWERIEKKNPNAVVVFDVPLLVESGGQEQVDKVIVVWVSGDIQTQRLMKRDGVSQEEAEKRIAAQMPLEEKLRYADFTIDGSRPLEEVKKQVIEVYEALKQIEGKKRVP